MMGRSFRIALCVTLLMASSTSATTDNKEPLRHVRRSSSKRTSQGKRNLRKKKPKGSVRAPFKRMVVKCPPTMSQENCLKQLSSTGDNIKLVHNLKHSHSLAIQVDESTSEDLQSMGVELTEDHTREPLYLADSIQYHRHLNGWDTAPQQLPNGLDLIGVKKVWNKYGVKGKGIKICVMDTGVDAQHPDLQSSNLDGYNGTEAMSPWNQDASGHGTHTTGIMAASDNHQGIVGVAPEVEIFMVRVFKDNGKFYGSDVVAAAEACRDAGAKIISMSLGGDGFEEAEHDVFKDLYLNHGILAVASAGNSGGPEAVFPSAYDNVISVAACDEDKNLAAFSTFNSHVDIAAPGVNITSTWTNGTYVSLSGTSMAAPHVSGVLALLLSHQPDATPDQLLHAITSTTQEASESTNVDIGIIDALAALEALDASITNTRPIDDSSCLEADLSIQTDQYGGETAYRLRRTSDGIALWKGNGLQNFRSYTESDCLDETLCYEFVIRDSWGDGILGDGIQLTYKGSVLFSGGDFGYGGYLQLGDGC